MEVIQCEAGATCPADLNVGSKLGDALAQDFAWPALVGTALTSTASLFGAICLRFRPEQKRLLAFLLNFSAGAMLADVLLHILPHAYEEHRTNEMFHHDHTHGHARDYAHDHAHGHSHAILDPTGTLLLLGIISFAMLDRVTSWLSTFGEDRKLQSAAMLNLAADALHNVADGMAIAAAYMSSPKLGRATVIASWLHELPQELGDFAILTSSGLPRSTALALNFFCGLIALFGTALVLILGSAVVNSSAFILSFTAGGMLYSTLSCVLPEASASDPGGPGFMSRVRALASQGFGIALGVSCLMLISLFE
eukprot:Plantae.Rhodophyta-Purpureofilum_apyrenoidigerum.ctg30330.p1 GENE.Plantae.Rhodophyta-Purpureofilum_apyrenoidigerum.ctg30330~~Plantae.Rhodophyta-Purpureofilum_apyrenoidigerum.ctg30330.p1  ORF type:complete len:309 (-),score=35.34 Plantae.Rhodophyta-Purpureofilum_apyrenoidigerum.ctg30330:76-1002(-)